MPNEVRQCKYLRRRSRRTAIYPLYRQYPFKESFAKLIMANDSKLKMAVIAGAAAAVKYVAEKKPKSSEEVINYINRNIDQILSNID
jgi:hypothetical protein